MASSSSSHSSSSDGPGGGHPSGSGPNAATGGSAYECNICLDAAKDAVVSMCGHLFCWPCIHQWLEMRPDNSTCPVCKAAISRDKVIPLYGRGNTEQKDPRDKVPPRPQGQRTEPEHSGVPGYYNFGFGGGGGRFHAGGFQMSFGFGGFPFGFFSSTVNYNPDSRPSTSRNLAPDLENQSFMSNVFLIIAIVCICWVFMT